MVVMVVMVMKRRCHDDDEGVGRADDACGPELLP